MSRVAMDAPHTWPLQLVLPLVRRDGTLWPELGLLVAGSPTVYLAELGQASPAFLRCCDKLVYPDFAAVVEAGWEVD